ncbi:MAG TPA: deoxyribonuclease V [Cyanobacteria bacterium UBA8530]|nr:deoxyribonuclease V [Cyanobacteria bacterium UBA8530]
MRSEKGFPFFSLTPAEAIAIQQRDRHKVSLEDGFGKLEFIGGSDVSSSGDDFFAAFVVLSYPELELVEVATAFGESPFPYIPGLLSFREIPILLEAWDKLSRRPDLVLVDGQGIAHPRRFGIASHLGVTLDLPTIGCGKSRLIGKYQEPGLNRGDSSVLSDKGEEIGRVLRTKNKVSPLFISPGHKVSLGSAVSIVLSCCTRYRLPEPTRLAHLQANAARKQAF